MKKQTIGICIRNGAITAIYASKDLKDVDVIVVDFDTQDRGEERECKANEKKVKNLPINLSF
jgi:hypothetical protein